MYTNNLENWMKAAPIYADAKEKNIYSCFCKAFAEAHFSDVKGLKVLDAGCGDGEYTEMFRAKGAQAFGCDGSCAVIELAKAKYPLCSFEVVDLTSVFPYHNESFDIVFSNLVLMDVDPLDTTIKEISRVLKRNGTLFFSIVHPAFYLSDWEKNKEGVVTHKKVNSYISQRSVQQAWDIQPVLHYHRPVSFYFNLFAQNGLFLSHMYEPNVYEDTKIPDIPLFLFAEFIKK
ncbi:MAG: class I SAM-dependent methyltransferase [Oscillospiraceae bacterium]